MNSTTANVSSVVHLYALARLCKHQSQQDGVGLDSEIRVVRCGCGSGGGIDSEIRVVRCGCGSAGGDWF